MRRLIVLTVLALLALPAATLASHDTQYRWGEAAQPALNGAMRGVPEPTFVGGACTGEARRAMPAAEGHDHLKPEQHAFACRMNRTFFDPLDQVLSARPDVVLGEMDIQGSLMAIGVAYPESGFLLYDISNPATPKFLSWYRGEECEQVVIDVDCGAYVDISPGGERVYLSVQQISVVPRPSASSRPLAAYPGVEVIDISTPTAPRPIQAMPVISEGGVHTTNSFVVPEGGGDGPREPGEYTVSVANGVGLMIHEVLPTGNLAPVEMIQIGETHDTFIQEDPILKRTLLYAAGGFSTGFYVWDVTTPSDPVPLAEWDPTPECGADWYAHTVDVAVHDGRRILTMPNELFFSSGEQEDDEGCGTLQGNGDHAGQIWFVDVTDFSRLPKFDNDDTGHAPDEELKAKSLSTLTTYWSNPAGRAAGELTFSPHNQQIVGDKIYLSQYHGGVVVLDAREALRGRNVRPHEIGLYVPHAGPTRPIVPEAGAGIHFFTGFVNARPLIWDTLYANGHVFIPDMTGGLTVVREDDAPPAVPGTPPGGPACSDKQAPTARLSRVRLRRRGVTIAGRASDRGCAKVSRVSVAVARKVGRKCSFLSSFRRFEKARSCSRPVYLTARGRTRWSFSSKARLRRWRYLVLARATDTAGNRGRVVRRNSRAR